MVEVPVLLHFGNLRKVYLVEVPVLLHVRNLPKVYMVKVPVLLHFCNLPKVYMVEAPVFLHFCSTPFFFIYLRSIWLRFLFSSMSMARARDFSALTPLKLLEDKMTELSWGTICDRISRPWTACLLYRTLQNTYAQLEENRTGRSAVLEQNVYLFMSCRYM